MTPDAYIDEILARLTQDKRVRRDLPLGGRIYFDRSLPFLCVYRRTADALDAPAEQLLSTQTAFAVVPGDRMRFHETRRFLRRIAAAQTEQFGGFLVLEIWFSPSEDYDAPVHEESGEPLPPAPMFRIRTDARRRPTQVVHALSRSLSKIRLLRQDSRVEWVSGKGVAPAGGSPFFSAKDLKTLGCHAIGLEIRPVFADPDEPDMFPGVLRSLDRALGRALRQTYHAFVRLETDLRQRHYHTLGRRSFVKAVWDVDRQLADVGSSFDLLLQATPINAEAAWLEFRRNKFDAAPEFQYRPLAVDATELKRRLFRAPIERIEDATLTHLFLEKQDELDRKITMLGDVGTPKFLPGSLQVHGPVDARLVELAEEIIRKAPKRPRRRTSAAKVRADEFKRLALAEVRRYQALDPTFRPAIEIRDDLYSGLLVSQGSLLIGSKASFAADRVEALLQHEVGTHLVTCHNGACQPFRQLSLGLAGYDVLQEGLAVLAEHLVGGLGRARVRLLAARVLAVRAMLDGADFVETFRLLNGPMRMTKRVAYTIAMRVHRGGGLTKDALYLQGLAAMLDYLGGEGEIEPLLTGKIAAEHIPLVEELRLRQILKPPPLKPRYLDHPRYAAQIERVRRGITVLELLKDK